MKLSKLCDILFDQKLIDQNAYNIVLDSEGRQKKLLKKIHKVQVGIVSVAENICPEISPVEIISSLKIANKKSKSKGPIAEDTIMEAIAKDTGYRYMKLNPLKLDIDIVTKTVPKLFAIKHLLVPVSLQNETLTVALYDPYDMEVLDNIKKVVNKKLLFVVSSRTDILKIINEFFGFKSSVIEAEKATPDRIAELGNLDQDLKLKSAEDIQLNDEPIKNAVDFLFNYALDQKASDIHLEPRYDKTYVRLRIDGILYDIHTIPKNVYPAFASRIKMLSKINIAERRRHQDGRLKIGYRNKAAEIRVSTMAVVFGEKIVMRILNPDTLFQDLENIGLASSDLIRVNSFIAKPHGLIMVTGPTGSGKTTTLYSILRSMADRGKNITSIEDPVEMICEDFNQVVVQPQIGITFASSIRTILRQDPDIIMVGEVRDSETAENAIQAALTGHMVFTSVHTNNAPSSITRLIDLGIEPFLIGSTLTGVIAQKLVRKICSQCKEKVTVQTDEIKSAGIKIKHREVELYQGKGCDDCRETGYKGRTGIFEILPVSNTIKKQINERESSHKIRQTALAEGMVSLKESAVQKMLKGITTLKEVVRTTSDE